MLPYMREQSAEAMPAEKTAGRDPSEPALPSAEQEFLTVAGNRQRLRNSTIVVVLLIGVGLGGLWLMIRKTHPQAAGAAQAVSEETNMEQAISRLTGVSSEMLSRMDQIVKKFHEFSDVKQVDVSELAKNPFELEMALASLRTRLNGQTGISEELIRRQQQEAQLREKVAALHLQSIMRSDMGICCMINDRILHQNDVINDLVIAEISDNHVVLIWTPNAGPLQTAATGDLLKTVLKLSE